MAQSKKTVSNKATSTYQPWPSISPCFADWVYRLDLQYLRESPEVLKKFCDVVKEFGYMNPEASNVSTFMLASRIPQRTLERWKEELPELDEAFKEMKQAIFARRKLAWDRKILSDTCYLRDAHKYGPEEDELNKYHANLTKESTHPAIVYQAVDPKKTGRFSYKQDNTEVVENAEQT